MMSSSRIRGPAQQPTRRRGDLRSAPVRGLETLAQHSAPVRGLETLAQHSAPVRGLETLAQHSAPVRGLETLAQHSAPVRGLETRAHAHDTLGPIGLVGPMSNYATPPQLVESVPYHDLLAMHAFARQWREEHRGKWFTTHKLSGFCLLMKRAVYETVVDHVRLFPLVPGG